MQSESPTLSHLWLLASNVITAFVTVLTTLTAVWFKRKREPAEVRKIDAETRQVNVSTDVSLIKTATEALAKAERVTDERNHWERKCEALQRQNDLLNIEVTSLDHQMRRLNGFIRSKGWSFSEYDQPKRL